MTLTLHAYYQDYGVPLLNAGFRLLAENTTWNGTAEGRDEQEYPDHGLAGADSEPYGGGSNNDAEHDTGFGVRITYDDLYNSIIFLTCIYISGQIASRFLKLPGLVGEIICGILLGPNLGRSNKCVCARQVK